MSRVPIVQKLDSTKKKNVSRSNNVMITDLETGEIICQNCGVVLQEKISLARKLDNIFTNNEYSSYAGNRSTLRIYDMGLATIIGTSNYDSTGRPLDYKIKPFMKRLRLWDARSKSKNTSERNLRTALFEMEKLKEKLSLSNAIMERSAYLYRKASKAKLIRGRSIKGIVGACVYVACREMDVARTIRDISKNLSESRGSIAKNYRMLFQNLKLTVSIPDPTMCIIKIANNLEIPENTKREAIHIFDHLKEKKLTAGKKPDAVAATVIYMASIKTGINLSKQKISKVSGITGVTIRNRYNEYIKHVKLI